MAKIEAGKLELFVERFELRRWCGELGVNVAPLIEKRGNVLRVRADDDLGRYRGDVTRLRLGLSTC